MNFWEFFIHLIIDLFFTFNVPQEYYTYQEKLEYDHRIFYPVFINKNAGACFCIAPVEAFRWQFVQKGEFLQFSAQQAYDCSEKRKPPKPIESSGLCLNESYPYVDKQGQCQEKTCGVKYKLDDFFKVKSKIADVKQALFQYGPLVADLDFSKINDPSHERVPWDGQCVHDKPNHAVLIITGYDQIFDQAKGEMVDVWICFNNYGHEWGDDGRFYLAMGQTGNKCGILTNAYALIMKKIIDLISPYFFRRRYNCDKKFYSIVFTIHVE